MTMLDAVMLLYPYMSSTNKMYSIRLPEVTQCDYEVYNMKKEKKKKKIIYIFPGFGCLVFSLCMSWSSCAV